MSAKSKEENKMYQSVVGHSKILGFVDPSNGDHFDTEEPLMEIISYPD